MLLAQVGTCFPASKVEKDRVENIRATRKLLGQNNTETVVLVPQSNLGPAGSVRTRDIAAAIMGVSPTYVGLAARVRREDPELFEKIWNGQITVNAAIRQLDGVTETPIAGQIRTLRRRLNAAFRKPDLDASSLARIEQVLDELGF